MLLYTFLISQVRIKFPPYNGIETLLTMNLFTMLILQRQHDEPEAFSFFLSFFLSLRTGQHDTNRQLTLYHIY